MEMKHCSRCDRGPDETTFHGGPEVKPKGRRPSYTCVPCSREKMRERYDSGDVVRGHGRAAAAGPRSQVARAAFYGITLEQLTQLLEPGVCDLCGRESEKLQVDHDHITGDVRGALCGRCNTALGLLGDDEEGVMRALTYLRTASRV